MSEGSTAFTLSYRTKYKVVPYRTRNRKQLGRILLEKVSFEAIPK